ncbi:zinc ribbon domain-containing protein [Caballeronia sordidicola]|uniref:zinc ribbon domain-containing protein n=1 Tax=Caballeronia sordidicola TaxID=196367 RepID=UPI00094D24AE
MIFIAGWLVCAILSAVIANAKNRNGLVWAIATIPFGLFATLVVACLSRIPSDEEHIAAAEPAVATKTCPACAEDVKAAARVCRFCGYSFDSLASARSFTEIDGEPYIGAPPSQMKFRGDRRL